MEPQRFFFINVNDRFDISTQEGMNLFMAKVAELFPNWTQVNPDPYTRNGYVEIMFYAPPITTEIGDVIYE